MEELYKPQLWKCATCSIEKKATAHQLRRTNCSKECMALAYKSQLVGANNPNYKNAHEKRCLCCKEIFLSYIKTRKYCSRKCYGDVRPKKNPRIKKPIIANEKTCKNCGLSFKCCAASHQINCSKKCALEYQEKKALKKSCAHCKKVFSYYASQKKIYCSYQCHIDSGGAFRAGIAAAEATLKYGPKKDANHNEVMEEMRKYCAVYDMSTAGMGIPDGVAWINNAWHLFDIKNPKTGYGRRGLNKVQKKWLENWPGGPVYLIYTTEEAARFAQGNFESIKFEGGGVVANVDTSCA